jgi:hypothetical protein
MEELIGKEIAGLFVSVGEEILIFKHPDGTQTNYIAYGECCSETWFADIVGVEALLGQVVMTSEIIEMSEEDQSPDDDRCRQEYDSAYGIKLTTAKGYTDIIFRNSSNGYYGGCIEHHKEIPSHLSFTRVQEITQDWQA